ncbi:hypothetical protein BO94DRAFT_587592 [Aspergillus sclerotioniger CBS 115572]|uniref:Uncharacterized protein n=1 Tax=Aspergillus sclerotioniger CBS 115572 TaxID=1450535 RepID=A0A317W2P5_9EURO|nr:hypothetical protein BO94DRAFT_587592 [Aspergillus sclerotioniger CBS 115572]PWY80846.1 hypothetical protein BO94DRAFT_587592 [Aspergillus sclerotioniger CBS 115572]
MEQPPSSQYSSHLVQQILNEIAQRVLTIRDHTELVFKDINPVNGLILCRRFVENANVERIHTQNPSLHGIQQQWGKNSNIDWVCDGRMTRDEGYRMMGIGVGTRFEGFTGYILSSDQPDLYVAGYWESIPSIVVEAGWSGSGDRLQAAKDLWLRGTSEVQVVVLLIWSKTLNNKVEGIAEVWSRAGEGGLAARRLAIFPEQNPLPYDDRIEFTKGQLIGLNTPISEPNTVLSLEMSQLRTLAEFVITLEFGMSPA